MRILPELGRILSASRDSVRPFVAEDRPMKKPLLVGSAGCGSVIAEFGFNLAGIAYDYEEGDYGEGSATRARLLQVNPLRQVPALVPPARQTSMTQSLATLHWR